MPASDVTAGQQAAQNIATAIRATEVSLASCLSQARLKLDAVENGAQRLLHRRAGEHQLLDCTGALAAGIRREVGLQ